MQFLVIFQLGYWVNLWWFFSLIIILLLIAFFSPFSNECAREAFLGRRQTRNVSLRDTVKNQAVARFGLNDRVLGYARDAGYFSRRHYSSNCKDKGEGKFTNKVYRILYELVPLCLYNLAGNFSVNV